MRTANGRLTIANAALCEQTEASHTSFLRGTHLVSMYDSESVTGKPLGGAVTGASAVDLAG